LIGVDRNEKLEIHDSLRSAYKARSEFVHGDNLSKSTIKKLEEISEVTDSITRRLLIKVIEEYSVIADFNAENMTKWYKEHIL
ncbi:hypothetical protein, partial [Pseudomonas sp. FW305-BF6]|uniref:hypothetical protein n=1 Tax=Pseudomonas sp. FW305-BF6 TaxID=2070673 RepID=UPI001304832C